MRRSYGYLAALGAVFAVAGSSVQGRLPWERLSDVATTAPIIVSSTFQVVSDTLHAGEAVSTLLERDGVHGADIHALASSLGFDPRQLRPGLVFSILRDPETLEARNVEFRPDADQRLQLIRAANGVWRGEAVPIRWRTDTIRCAGVIQQTLYDAIDGGSCDSRLDEGDRIKLSYELADENAWSIDFTRDIQTGDAFVAIVERQVSDEGDVRLGNILASDLTVGGKDIDAYRFSNDDGGAAYYDDAGNAVRRAFLKVPLEFRYISSRFSYRLHPILGKWMKHQGIDYAAPTGTPVHATGDGVVTIAGFNGGYGRMIEIRHANGITTRYGHLSHIETGIRRGTRVTQGEVIGRVGMTGLATGPHLHYEFRVDGVARDPATVKSKAGPPLPATERQRFMQLRGALAAMLHPGGSGTAAALADE
jgi:murein DD-endopeptidase MepM/ murein hydrolase activator NlpD